MEKSRILLIIPAYNEEKNIINTVNSIKENKENYDYIVINDGSKDNTLKVLQDNNINHINLIQNLGIGGAVQTGYKYAYYNGYDIAVQFDGDGQHDVNYVKNICQPIIDGNANICIGSRYLDNSTSKFKSTFMRRLGKNIISIMLRIFIREKVTDPTSGFRAVDKNIIKLFAEDYPTDYPEPESLVNLNKARYKIMEVPVSMNERKEGVSSIHAWKSISYMVKVSLAILIDSLNKKKRVK
ncbi:MAG: glycosyltransferase family 2 protein [Clostridia bacterium]|nr:glycosyltransferase family 2 protein [Clostridia bacterium]